MRGKKDVAHSCRECFWLFTAWSFINDLTESRSSRGINWWKSCLEINHKPDYDYITVLGFFSLGWGIFSFHLVSWLAWGKDCVWRSMMIWVIMVACGHVVFLMSWRRKPSRMPYKGNSDRIQSHLWRKLRMEAVEVQKESEWQQ